MAARRCSSPSKCRLYPASHQETGGRNGSDRRAPREHRNRRCPIAEKGDEMTSIESAVKVAILDDYQNVALQMADWSPLAGRGAITCFNSPPPRPDAPAAPP